MGYGDDIMATGLARGFAARGKLAAFGDGRRIIWGPWSEEMFRHNPNIAGPNHPTSDKRIEWVAHYKGNRMYNKSEGARWKWNYKFKVRPGEFYFSKEEKKLADMFHDFVVVEPNLPWQKKVAGNKDWGEDNYDHTAELLMKAGHRIIQFVHKNTRRRIPNATFLEFQNFRDAIAVLSKADLYVGPEGGMHHAAAAVSVPAVIIMGGFIPASVVGYDTHVNLTGGVEACGNIEPCIHCRNAMKKITVDSVVYAASKLMEGKEDERRQA